MRDVENLSRVGSIYKASPSELSSQNGIMEKECFNVILLNNDEAQTTLLCTNFIYPIIRYFVLKGIHAI